MIEYTLRINKEEVMTEVAKTTSYIGAKADDENAYERVSTTDEDEEMLRRFWDECEDTFCALAKRLITETSDDGSEFTVTLGLSDSFQEALGESARSSLFSFFVTAITSKWNAFAAKEETQGYGAEAQAHIDMAMRKLMYKKAPVRPKFD